MTTKKYQVFLSSTFQDLVEERRQALNILLMADCIPAGMEIFVATDDEQFNVIKKVIDLCDYYILIIGKRYGSVNPATGISYTEMEYEYAKKKNIPVLVFALDDSIILPDARTEKDPDMIRKLHAFKDRAMNNRLASVWSSAGDLSGKLAVAIMRAFKEIERPGWQRGVDYDEASLRRRVMEQENENKELHVKLEETRKQLVKLINQDSNLFIDEPIITRYKTFLFEWRRTDATLLEIFIVIAIEMLNHDVSEYKIQQLIFRHLFHTSEPTLSDPSFFKTTLCKFAAQGLIEQSNSNGVNNAQRHQRDNNSIKKTFWHLTEKGIQVRNRKLIPRSE